MRYRADEVSAREDARVAGVKFVTGAQESVASWERTKPWVNGTDRSAILKQVRMIDMMHSYALQERDQRQC